MGGRGGMPPPPPPPGIGYPYGAMPPPPPYWGMYGLGPPAPWSSYPTMMSHYYHPHAHDGGGGGGPTPPASPAHNPAHPSRTATPEMEETHTGMFNDDDYDDDDERSG